MMIKKIMEFISIYLYAMASCVYLFLAGFISLRNRTLIYEISSHFGYPETRLPEVEISSIIPVKDALTLNLLEPLQKDGNVSLIELLLINIFINYFKPANVFEMGTFDGRTTLNMAANIGDGTRIWTIDLPMEKLQSTTFPIEELERKFIDKEQSGSRFLLTKEENKIIRLYGDTATYDFSPFTSKMDFIFIDASHSYEYVLNDSKIAMGLLRNKQGIILWHDYGVWEGVTRALEELCSMYPEFKGIKHIKGTSLACMIGP